MLITFNKYQGTGNDFVILDQRKQQIIDPLDQKLIAFLCDRRFGIGADGLILLEESVDYDFKMVYFNSDGKQSTMCGNGGRCIVHLAWTLGMFDKKTEFEAVDGMHKAEILKNGEVSLQMRDVSKIIKLKNGHYELNTGSPHFVKFCDKMPVDIKNSGAEIRYSDQYSQDGINVNFVVVMDESSLNINTYERGVEDETLSCGTGVTAAALAFATARQLIGKNEINVHTKGGRLSVSFVMTNKNECYEIWLTGPAVKVFSGTIQI